MLSVADFILADGGTIRLIGSAAGHELARWSSVLAKVMAPIKLAQTKNHALTPHPSPYHACQVARS